MHRNTYGKALQNDGRVPIVNNQREVDKVACKQAVALINCFVLELDEPAIARLAISLIACTCN